MNDIDSSEDEVVFESPAVDISEMPPNEAVASLLQLAVETRASDMYLLTDEYAATVAMRRLGTVETICTISKEQIGQLIRYIKTNAGMDIAESRRPLDGRVEILALEHVEPAELLLGLGERTVGRDRLAVTDLN